MKKERKIYPVAIDGSKIYQLALWKVQNPRAIYFDSEFERQCYLCLKNQNFNFQHHPDSRLLQDSFDTWSLNRAGDKVIKSKVRAMGYTSDFLVICEDGTRVYIEAKGFFREDGRMRYKLFQARLEKNEFTFLVKTIKELLTVVNFINTKFESSISKEQKEINKDKLSVFSVNSPKI